MPFLFLLNGIERSFDKTSSAAKPASGNFEISSVPPTITASQMPALISFLAVENAFIPDEHAVDTPQKKPSNLR